MKVRLNKTTKEDSIKKVKRAKEKYVEENRKINQSRKKIREEIEKIKVEKKNIRKRKLEKISKTKIGRILNKIRSFLKVDKDDYAFSEVLVITIFSLILGAISCFVLIIILSGGKNYLILSKELNKFVEVYETISNNYYEEVDKDKLIEEAINGMVSSMGDVYTSYSDKEGASDFSELVTGTYEGIGCTIQLQEKGIVVVEVFPDGPAFKSGLLAGDIILFIDDKDVSSMSANSIAEYIKNESDSNIKMKVSRNDIQKEINLVRGKVETPVVNSIIYEKNGKKIGYLSLSMFTSVATGQFNKKLKALEKDGIEALVIDVRNNSGGYLSTVTDIVSNLLPKGDIIYQINEDGTLKPTKDKTASSKDYPIAVLVNGGSASASEILAAAVKESYKGYVVGTKTYGKGTVQQVKKLSDGSMIKYTIDKWLTPDGIWINEVGLIPTHEVEMSLDYYDNPVVENDNQLQKALELVSE